MSLPIETLLDKRYRLLCLLGRGGYGEVYKAFDELLQRNVAVKILSGVHGAVSAASVIQQLQKEARATANIDHPNIVSTYSIGSDPAGSVYLVMEYVDGKPLSVIINQNGPLELPVALVVFIQIASAMSVLHGHGVMHRDLNPRNILLLPREGDRYCAKVLDFGTAKLERKSTSVISRVGRTVGTAGYMSPEQCIGLPFDVRSEIYAFGLLMYESLTGKRAHPLQGPQSLVQTVKEYPLKFSEVAPALNLPEPVENIVFRAVSKNPEDRYQSFDAVRQDLARVAACMAAGEALPPVEKPVLGAFPLPKRKDVAEKAIGNSSWPLAVAGLIAVLTVVWLCLTR